MASYLDGRLAAGQVEAVERHLANCAVCRRAVGELRGLLAAPATVMPPADFAARAAGVVAPAHRAARLWRRAARWSAVAAAVLIVAWCGFAAGRKTYRDRQAADTAVARRATFDLGPDGERIVASVDAFDAMLLAGGDEQ
jgi:predicted anti-sigma-YlaC factor YlaD